MNLQQIVEELAAELGRSVVINDLEFKPIVASAQGTDVDAIRVDSLLQRSTPSAAVVYLRELDLENLRGSRTIDLARFGALARLVTPIKTEGTTVAYLWLITGGKPRLTSTELDSLDAAVQAAASELSGTSGPTSVDRLLEDLFSPERGLRMAALEQAVEARIVTSVNAFRFIAAAVDLDDVGFTLRRGGLQRTINTPGSQPVYVVALHLGRLMIVSPGAVDEVLFARIQEGLRNAGLPPTGIGSSDGETEEDPLVVAEHAIDASRYAAALPQRSGVDYEEIGALALVNPESVSLRRIAGISEAARHLLLPGQETARKSVLALLDSAGDVRTACDVLHLHRTTLYYRLDRLDPVVKEALADGWRRTSLHVALRLAALRDGGS